MFVAKQKGRRIMQRIRTIDSAYNAIKQLDPHTAVTKYRIRQIVVNCEIPCKNAGRKYTFDMNDLLNYYRMKG